MKEQIEEMAKVIQDTWLPCMEGMNVVGELRIGSRDANRIATNLYSEGYRKQKDGEWCEKSKDRDEYYEYCYKCSVCGHWAIIACEEDSHYCPNCGAKMKGDE